VLTLNEGDRQAGMQKGYISDCANGCEPTYVAYALIF